MKNIVLARVDDRLIHTEYFDISGSTGSQSEQDQLFVDDGCGEG